MTDKLIELAKECEEAEAGRRDLNFQIRRALAGEPIEFETCWTAQQAVRWANGDSSDERKTPVYTASLDAALTLVPEGWTFANLSQSDRKGWWCELRQGYLTSYDKVAFGGQLENASPALAVAAAALRARAVQ
jgi:hypothetical protein